MASIGINKDDSDQQISGLPFSSMLARAVDLFVMRKFDTCFHMCCDVVKAAKCEPEQERNDEVIEAAAALGIQALAEMDKWQDTVAFIKDVYGAVHLCSARILQVCILLHAHVEEYLPCHKLVHSWLRNPQNASSKQCVQVIRQYGSHVLIPTGHFVMLKEVIDMCPVLDEDERESLLRLPEAGRFEDAKSEEENETVKHKLLNFEEELKETRVCSVDEDPMIPDTNENNDTSKTDPSSRDPVCVLELCKHLYNSFLGKIKSRWRERFIFIMLGIFAFWALLQTQSGDSVSSLSRLVTLWQGLFHRLKILISST